MGALHITISVEIKPNVAWMPPDSNSLKLNVDAAYSSSTKEASFGMVVQDHLGSMLLYVMTKVDGIVSPLHVEIKVLLFGLELAMENSFLSRGLRVILF